MYKIISVNNSDFLIFILEVFVSWAIYAVFVWL